MRISDWSSDVCSSDLRDRASPIIASDTHAYRRAITFIDAAFTEQRPPLHAQARGLIMQLLTSGDCTNERIATELKLHARTVHRRLAIEGTSFHRIKDEVRRAPIGRTLGRATACQSV